MAVWVNAILLFIVLNKIIYTPLFSLVIGLRSLYTYQHKWQLRVITIDGFLFPFLYPLWGTPVAQGKPRVVAVFHDKKYPK